MATFWRGNRVDAESTKSDIPGQTDFTNVPLDTEVPTKRKKQPRTILHFSDGILEEYSTDEEDDKPPPPPPADPQAGRSDEDGEQEDRAYGDKCDKEKEQSFVSHDQADTGMDSEDELVQQQPTRKKKKQQPKTALDMLSQEIEIGEQHGYDTKKQSSKDGDNSSDLSSAEDDKSTDVFNNINGGMEINIASEGKNSVFVTKSAKKCIFIPETKIVMYSNEASCILDDWSLLFFSKEMYETNSKFEIEVIHMGETGQIVLGILFNYNYTVSAPPGWCHNSVGYHLNNGSIYSGKILEATKTNVIPAKKGDRITLEIRSGRTEGQEFDETYFHFKINNNDIISSLELPGLAVYGCVLPCIAMSSKGAAVKLLNDTCWKVIASDGSDDKTPLMSTVEKDGIMISPKEVISMSERSGCVYGLMSICNTSPNKQSIAFEVRYGKSDTSIVRGVLAYTQAWAERLCIHKDDLQEAITVEWTPIHNDDATTYPTKENWTLEEICQTMKTERQSYTLKLNAGPKEKKCDSKSKTTDGEEPMDSDDVLKIARYTGHPWEIDSVIRRGRTSSENAGSLEKAPESGHSVYELLQMLANVNYKDFQRDEDTILKKVKKTLKVQEGDYEAKIDDVDFIARYDDGSGSTILHFVAELGSKRLVDLLNKHVERIEYLSLVKNFEGNLPLQLAITRKHDETAKTLLEMMECSGFSIVDIFWNKSNKDSKKGIELTIKELLDSKMFETTKWVLSRFEDRENKKYLVAPLELDDEKRCPNDEGYNRKDKTAYDIIVQNYFKELANHKCVKSLSEYKWRQYGQIMFWVSLGLYLIFWGFLTMAVVTGVTAEDATKYDQPVDYVRLISEVAALCYAILTLLGEALQLYFQRMDYFSDGYNYLDILSSILIISVLPLRLVDSGGQWGCFAVGYIIWTFRSIKFLTVIRFQGLGQLGHIIIRLILKDVWKFALYFLVTLFGFSGGLFLTLKGDTNLNVHNETSTFWGILFVGVRVLIEGQPFLDYTGPEGYRLFSCIIMLIFLASTCVVMLNIFIAQLSGRYKDEIKKVEERFEKRRVATMLDRSLGLWRILNRLLAKDFKETVDTYKPQRSSDVNSRKKKRVRRRRWDSSDDSSEDSDSE